MSYATIGSARTSAIEITVDTVQVVEYASQELYLDDVVELAGSSTVDAARLRVDRHVRARFSLDPQISASIKLPYCANVRRLSVSQICNSGSLEAPSVTTMLSWREEYMAALRARDDCRKPDYDLIDACKLHLSLPAWMVTVANGRQHRYDTR